MFEDFEKDPEAAEVVARIAARNKFGADTDLTQPEIQAWMRDFAAGWADGVARVRTGLDQVMREPNAWSNKSFVLAALCDAGVSADTIVTVLRALPSGSGAGHA